MFLKFFFVVEENSMKVKNKSSEVLGSERYDGFCSVQKLHSREDCVGTNNDGEITLFTSIKIPYRRLLVYTFNKC